MPPVGANVSAFSVISERWTAARWGPVTVHLADQCRQNSSVDARTASGFTVRGRRRWLGVQVSTNGTRSPALTVKSLTVCIRSPRSGASVTR